MRAFEEAKLVNVAAEVSSANDDSEKKSTFFSVTGGSFLEMLQVAEGPVTSHICGSASQHDCGAQPEMYFSGFLGSLIQLCSLH